MDVQTEGQIGRQIREEPSPRAVLGESVGGAWTSKLRLALIVGLCVACISARPAQISASAPPLQDIDFAQARRRMVEQQIEARGVTDSRILEAMSRVPRHEYVPVEYAASAYRDTPLQHRDHSRVGALGGRSTRTTRSFQRVCSCR